MYILEVLPGLAGKAGKTDVYMLMGSPSHHWRYNILVFIVDTSG
jgi:hypothetical protein